MRRQTDTSNNFFDRRKPLRANAVAPDIIVGPVWLYDEQPSSIEIIELNSSNEVDTSPRQRTETNVNNGNDTTYHVNSHGEHIEDRFEINRKARERRCLLNNNHVFPSTYTSDSNAFKSDFENNFYTNHSANHTNDEFNHQMNCFTIFNKHFMDSESNTSTEGEYGDVEIITSNDIIDRTNWEPNNNLYNEEIITYGTDLDQETRTIWIYSYKNKHLIADDDFAVNNASKEMSSSNTSHSTDSSGEQTADKSTSFCRLGSPVAPTYIPRLDLSLVPTLSTVTEISEHNAQPTPKESNKSLNRNIKKPSNNWFASERTKLDSAKSVRKHEKATNIINWMGLSPRERRRVLKDNSSTDRWVGSHLNLSENNIDDHGDKTNDEVVQNENKTDGLKVLVDVEVHVDVNDKSDNSNVTEQLKSPNEDTKIKAREVPKINKIKYDEICEEFQKDRGDHSVKLVVAPAIRLTPKKKKSTDISDPIETLESSNWIRETRDERVTNVYDYVLDVPEHTVDRHDRAWMRNSISFLKPTQWTAFAPISETPVSYHLSLGSITEERRPWYKRLIDFIFNCCK